jgi:hypothetical protein
MIIIYYQLFAEVIPVAFATTKEAFTAFGRSN